MPIKRLCCRYSLLLAIPRNKLWTHFAQKLPGLSYNIKKVYLIKRQGISPLLVGSPSEYNCLGYQKGTHAINEQID